MNEIRRFALFAACVLVVVAALVYLHQRGVL
jgi:hypothetical protein